MALTMAMTSLPVSAAGTSSSSTVKSGWTSKVLLPSAGISYALSAKKTSLRDVENKLVRTGKMNKIKSATAVKYDAAATAASETTESSDGTEIAASSTVASNSESVVAYTAAQAYEDEINAIVDTTLTPVQEKEKAVIQRAQLQKQADVVNTEEISESEAITASTAAPTVTTADLNKPIVRSGEESTEPAETLVAEAPAEAAEEAAGDTASESAEETETEASSEAATEDTAAESSDSNLVVSNVTTNDYINIRQAPNTDSEIVGKLYSGSVGEILEETSDGWVKIQSGSVTGYVKKDYVATGSTAQQMADEVKKDQAVVTTTTLRVRAAATVDSDVISLIGQGQKLDIIAEEGDFYKVSTADGDGYISKDFADVETIYPDAVSIAEEEAAAAAEKAKQEAANKSSGSSGSGSSSTQSASGSSKGQQVVNYAMQFIGNPYVWGGSSLTNGTDCSGFTMAVYAHFGVSLPHYDASQRSCGTAVSSLAEARPGDLICYSGHVGIYIGNGQIVHASNPSTGITTGSATYRQILAIRRIFN